MTPNRREGAYILVLQLQAEADRPQLKYYSFFLLPESFTSVIILLCSPISTFQLYQRTVQKYQLKILALPEIPLFTSVLFLRTGVKVAQTQVPHPSLMIVKELDIVARRNALSKE